MLELKIGLSSDKIVRLPLNKEIKFDHFRVTLLEANHCPGAVLLFFRLNNGKCILHTGDFRADDALISNQLFQDSKVSTLYLDTTYLNPKYTFPSQKETIQFTTQIVLDCLARFPNTLVVTGTYTIGKERIFVNIAHALKKKIFVTNKQMKIYKCLEDKDLLSCLTTDKSSTNVHVVPMKQLSISALFDLLAKYSGIYTKVLAIKPTGWAFDKCKGDLSLLTPPGPEAVSLLEIPYSEHSSFNELRNFVRATRPTKIIPTVNVGNPQTRDMMKSHLDRWRIS